MGKQQPKAFYDFLEFASQQFKEESARGAIVLGTAWIDYALEDALREYLVNGDTKDVLQKNLTFGPKIALAFRIGLISKKLQNNLEIINHIRNKLVHCKWEKDLLRTMTWNSTDIQQLAQDIVDNFQSVIQEFPDVRKKFSTSKVTGDFHMILAILTYYFWFLYNKRIKPAEDEPFYKGNYKRYLIENPSLKDILVDQMENWPKNFLE